MSNKEAYPIVIYSVPLRLLIGILIVLSFSAPVCGQVEDPFAGEQVLPVDSLYAEDDTTTVRRNTFTEIFSGKPGKAALYSLLVPGGGQIYNKKWWKLPLVYALEGTTVYFVIRNHRQYNRFDDCYRQLLNDNSVPCLNVTDPNIVFNARQIAKKNREYSWIFFIAGRLLTIFDAFVDRHLMEFDISEDLSLSPTELLPPGAYVSFSLKVPLSPRKKMEFPIVK